MEWRQLFKVAEIPPLALEDIQSTRTLINIVTNTVGDSGVETGTPKTGLDTDGLGTGQREEKVDLNILESRATYRTVEGELKCSPQAWPEIKVHSEQFPEFVDHPGNPYNFKIAIDSGEICTAPTAPVPPNLPPSPPLAHSFNPSLLEEVNSGLSVLPVLGQRTQDRPSSGMSLQASDLLSQKSKLKPHGERQCITFTHTKPDGSFRVIASELQMQKDLLKSTSVPHPNQLTDLTTIHPERLTGLADILKKV